MISGGGTVVPTTQNLPAGTTATTFDLSEVGQYEFKITDDKTGCYTVVTHSVNPYNLIEVKATRSKTVSCFGVSDGAITLETVGYAGAYTWEVLDATTLTLTSLTPPKTGNVNVVGANNPNKITITGLPAGKYVVRVTETGTPFCVVESTQVSVSGPTAALTATATVISQLTCAGNDATIDVEAKDGWGGYMYRLDINGAAHPVYGTYTTTSTFVGLGNGSYNVYIKDREGCEIVRNQMISTPTPITVNVVPSVTALTCYGDKSATITATATGGSGNYKYVLITKTASGTIESGAQNSGVFNNLGAGVYEVKVIDGWGCDEVSFEVTITEPERVQVTAVISKGLTCLTDAEITLTATGGSGTGYTFSESPAGPFTTTNVFANKGVGTYTFYAKDANGCTSEVSNTIEISAIEALGLNIDQTLATVRCNGESTAIIRAEAYGGLGNYQYELITGGVVTQTNTTGMFENLPKGAYDVKVTSGGR